MANNHYRNNQPPMGPMMPPPAPMPIRQRLMNWSGKMKNAFPKWLSQYPIAIFILALAVISFMYSAYSLPWYYLLSGVVAVVVFFLYGSTVTKETGIDRIRKEKAFEKRIFAIAFVPRLILTILLYIIFTSNYGDSFGFETGDALFYNELGGKLANGLRDGHFIATWKEFNTILDISDMGYSTYMSFVYYLTDDSILFFRLIKCLLSTFTVLLIYRLAKREFGEQTGRLTAIFCALWPNFWYYCAVHLKETEMVFLAVLFVEQSDQMLRSRQFTAWKVIPILLVAAAIFTFRTALGLVAILALVFSVVMSSARVVNWGKRIVVGGLAIALIGVTMGNRIEEQTQHLLQTVQSGQQQHNMEWRARRTHGNSFAKYAGAAVFAPMIFTLPFPTMVRPFDGQEVQQFLNGGNYVKNIMSCFTIFALVTLLMSGKWREHLLPLSFMAGYVVVLAFSTFAQSERFHQPAMPFEFMFAAYGLSVAVTKAKYKRWFTYWSALMFVACIAWNWIKLKGRGL